ncbi:MAG: GNAT family N-acetyltransferase [Opitutaceae bacterium]|nr:GNAT family N-acetyltransferase [Opitutaceae bacterium]
MPSPFTIRPAIESDLPLLLQFIRDLADYEKLAHECVADETKLRAAMFGPRPCAEALLGFADGEPAAFAVFFQNFSTFLARPGLYLEDLFVRPAHRRRGYAKALLQYLAREANRRGCGRFEWTVLEWNKPAIEFYESLGATVLPDWRVCRLTGDALVRFGR